MLEDQTEMATTSTKSKEVIYTISNYEDARNSSNKSASHDPADYIQKARVTKAVPPKPAYDPLQFVQLRPCSLVKSAQEQVKKAETVKKIQEEKKEEPEEWQCNLDSWKSSRRKRVEHIIDRVVEVKKYELEEHDRNRRKSKTFNEMMEERGNRGSRRLKHLPIYTDDDNNDLTEFGLGACDKNETLPEIDDEESNNNNNNENSSTCQSELTEYTYEGAIEGYKSRISRAGHLNSSPRAETCSAEELDAASICGMTSSSEDTTKSSDQLGTVSKTDFLRRKELFEKAQCGNKSEIEVARKSTDFISTVSIKERLSVLQLQSQDINNENDRNPLPIPDTSLTDLKNRLEVFEREIKNIGNDKQNSAKHSASPDYLSNTVNACVETCGVPSKEVSKTTQQLSGTSSFDNSDYCLFTQKQSMEINDTDQLDTDREDSGIHTTDVSCSVSQADDQNEETEHHVEDDDVNKNKLLSSHQSFEMLPPNKQLFENAQADSEEIHNDRILDDALEMAFQEIDTMEIASSKVNFPYEPDAIHLNMVNSETITEQIETAINSDDLEPYYQVPKSQEPYYEVPKTKSIPLYENVDIMRAAAMRSSEAIDLTLVGNIQQPPKEKPPPPPVETIPDDRVNQESNLINFKRINSTKRIKNEIRNSRSSFLGMESEMENEGSSMLTRIQNNRPEQNYLSQASLYSDIGPTHSRQNSDLSTSNYGGSKEIFETNQFEDQHLFPSNNNNETSVQFGNPLQQTLTEETNRWLIDNEFLKQENINNIANCVETPHDMEQAKERNHIPPPIPPAKPLRSQQLFYLNNEHRKCLPNMPNHEFDQLRDSTMSLCENQTMYNNTTSNNNSLLIACNPLREQSRFSKSSQALNSAEVPAGVLKPQTPNETGTLCGNSNANEYGAELYPFHKNMLQRRSQTECSPHWGIQPSWKPGGSNNRHWLIQEAEQRRIEQQANIFHSTSSYSQNANRKSLPDSVIQTITQRVQTLGIGTDRRWNFDNPSSMSRLHVNEASVNPSSAQSNNYNENDDKILSVSGKKKCSHCNNELGRGAAMVIESLGLLYHIDCFKCCVCHTRLGDGFKGTDVRVRKYKLHCQNCFSSEDGVKFSCV